jgi:outer membrane protein TolC
MQLYESQRRLTDAQLGQVKVNYMPKLSLIGAGALIEPGIAFGPETINSILIAGLGLSWNTSGLYSGKKSQQLNRISMDKIKIQEETFLFNTNLNVMKGNEEVNRYRELLRQDDEIVRLRKSIREAYEIKYDNGMTSMNEVLNSVTQEREALAARSMREIQLLMSLYSIKTVMGN